MTDKQIMFLSEIAYMDDLLWPEKYSELRDVNANTVIPDEATTAETLGELLEVFDEQTLAEMDKAGGEKAKEAAIIREIRGDPELCELEIHDINGDVFAVTFEDPNGELIVAFRGTGTAYEWYDDAVGLGTADTVNQIQALEYIESLDGESITVTGHSKGGNKAQYVTLLSDKVDRCVSMDGQGFSGEFVDKYQGEIRARAGKIKNYYVDGDYVNILLYPVPGSQQICVDSTSDVTDVDFHYSSSFYQYYQDSEGRWHLGYRDENGEIQDYLKLGSREESMQLVHEFTCFVLNVMPLDERQETAEYVGALLAIVRRGGFQYKGIYYTDVKELLLSDPKMLGRILAYVIKYAETYGLNERQIESLVGWLGMREFLQEKIDQIQSDKSLAAKVGVGVLTVGGLLKMLMENLHDGKRDYIINWLTSKLGAQDLWNEVEDAYESIPDFHPQFANQNYAGSAKIRDFTTAMESQILNAIHSISRATVGSVSGWSEYSSEEWYDDLFIDNAIRGITTYFNRIREVNTQSEIRIRQVFASARALDAADAGMLREVAQQLRGVAQGVDQIADRLK